MLVFFSFCFVFLLVIPLFGSCFPMLVCLLSILFLFVALGYFGPDLCSPFVSILFSVETFSIVMVSVSVWVTLLMYLVSMKYLYDKVSSFLFSLVVFFLMLVVCLFFLVDDFIFFYVLFELSLLPTLVLILKWGYQPERLQAGMYFMIYTVCASLPLLLVIILSSSILFSTSMVDLYPFCFISGCSFSYLFYVCFLLAFLVKVPMWGVHLWLPKAHVEAPVSGSMILAGVLLKLGGFGIMKVSNLLFQVGSGVSGLFVGINLWGAFLVSVLCISSVDLKSLIAYSSVVHMGIMVVGLFSESVVGWLGAMLMMVSHGFSSPGLFSLASFNYEVTGTRNILLQKGVGVVYPSVSFFWFMLLIANMGAPPSLNFISEFFICVSVLSFSCWLGLIFGFVVFLSAGYNLYVYSSQQGLAVPVGRPSVLSFSSFYLSNFLHIVPVYLAFFLFFVVYV